MEKHQRVLISGAGIAGLTLAHQLKKQGLIPTIVERNPTLRTGGYKIDIRGTALEVVRRMGVFEALSEKRTDFDDVGIYDYSGKHVASIDIDVSGGRVAEDLELMRGDLCRVLMDRLSDVECLFGESVTEITERENEVLVHFEHLPPRWFDIVIGADGLHSKVRSVVFGDESQFLKQLGFCVAVFTIPRTSNVKEREYVEPGKYVNVYNSRDASTTTATFGFIPQSMSREMFAREEQVALLISSFEDAPEEVKEVLAKIGNATDFYFDSVAQVHMPAWSKGRVALVGDAGYAPTPISGQGTSVALIGAYVLADELAKEGYRSAFERYEAALRSFVAKNQELVGFSLAYMGIDPDAWTSKFLKYLIERYPVEWESVLKEFGVKQIQEAANAFHF